MEIARKNCRSHLMEYLFLASIVPVQDFIASARRTRDLCFGSWLLSELAKAAAKKIADEEQNRLIFPAPDPANKDLLSPGSSLNVANKIVALIHQSPRELGKKVHQAILGMLYEIRVDAFQGINSQIYYFQKTTHISTLPFLHRLQSIENEPEKTEAIRLWEDYTSTLRWIARENGLVFDTETIPDSKAHPILKEFEGTLLFEERIADV